MGRIIDLSVKLEDFMPSHKNLQRPFVKRTSPTTSRGAASSARQTTR